MKLAQERRGEFQEIHYLDATRARLTYLMPLSES